MICESSWCCCGQGHLPTADSPLAGHDGDSPALNLAEFCVRDLDLQGKPWYPHGDMQGCAQVLVGEIDHGVHLALDLLTIDKDIVTAVGDL